MLSVANQTKFVVRSNGQVGILKTNPDYALDVVGDIRYDGDLIDVSDERLKENIESLPCDYGPKDSHKYTKDRIGLIAQDVQKVYPELVGEDNYGYLTLNYIDLIPVLIEAIKEQQTIIDTLSYKLDQLVSNEKIYISQQSIATIGTNNIDNNVCQLYQNSPNPFTEGNRN